MSFVHLHLHTEYSMLDGLNRVRPMLEKVKESGMDSVAISDHGVMYGATEFWLATKDYGIKPIIGCEVYLAAGKHTERKAEEGVKYYHLLLLAKNKVGYQNLTKLVSIAQVEGMYYKPRIDRETLAKYSEGLICTSACLAGPLARNIVKNQEDIALQWLHFLKDTFKEDFYLELQRHGFNGQDVWTPELDKGTEDEIKTMRKMMKVNNKLKEWSAEYKIKMIATTDAHYLNKDDIGTQEILFAIKDGKKLTDSNRRLGYVDTYVMTPTELQHKFSDIPEVMTNTLEIAEKIEQYSLAYERVQPHYLPVNAEEKKMTAQEILRRDTYIGAEEKYGKVTDELKERIEYELDVIHTKGYDDYFLVVADIINWARSQEIVVGVRGSAAGSVVAYCVGIINIEPISWELYFERFLNPQRPSPPDIDMDFQDDRRDEVIRYVEQKYGKDNVVAICAIGRMKTKAAIRDVARVMDVNLAIADKLSKMVHVKFGKVKPIYKMMDDDPEFASIINSDPQLQVLKETVSKIEGMARHVSKHACGNLITPTPITDYVSVVKESSAADARIMTQAEGVWLEELGLMKFDFLGLRNLTIIKNTIDLIEKYHGVKIETANIPLDDKKTFELFGKGETIGVFQFESPPMQKYLKELQPENLEDICFMVSAYRPGPMQYIPDYIACKHGKSEPKFLIPEMVPILEKTYGYAIYQEQVIKIAVDIAGYSMGDADLLRRAMGKKKIDVMKKEEVKFKEGVLKLGYDEDIAQQIWNYLLPFADYGFNKAHGASYALVAYWCAYLKAHYPIEFMTGLMHSDISDTERVVVDMAEARRMGYTILPPDINKSEVYFSIEKGSYIRFGLGAIKHVGLNIVDEIITERKKNGKYKSFPEFLDRNIVHKINKKALECLIKVGALDKFGRRNQLLAILNEAYDQAAGRLKSKASGQVDLFGNSTEDSAQIIQITLPNLPDIDDQLKISWEKELIGTFITSHPLQKYQLVLLNDGIFPLRRMPEFVSSQSDRNPKRYKFLAMISSIRTVLTKNGSKPMAILQIEDQDTKSEAVVFPNPYAKLKQKLVDNTALIFEASVSPREDRFNLLVEEIYPIDSIENNDEIKVDLTKISDLAILKDLKESIIMYKDGPIKLTLSYGNKDNPKVIVTTIKPEPELINNLSRYMPRHEL